MATRVEMPLQDAQNREVLVHISVKNGKIHVKPDPFYVRKNADEEVKWICTEGNGEFLVEFGADGPFYESQFNKDAAVSGLARRAVLPDRHRVYKYTVWVGNKMLDPGGVVQK